LLALVPCRSNNTNVSPQREKEGNRHADHHREHEDNQQTGHQLLAQILEKSGPIGGKGPLKLMVAS
jgi:hypothetical protein